MRKRWVLALLLPLLVLVACGEDSGAEPNEPQVRVMTHTPNPDVTPTDLPESALQHPEPTAEPLDLVPVSDEFIAPPFADEVYFPVLPAPNAITDFTLPATLEDTDFTLSDYRGKYLLVYFGFTSCPDICPLTFAELNRAYRALGEPQEDVQIVFVSVDPERDTLDRLEEYMAAFNADFVAVRGESLDALRPIMRDFGAVASHEPLPDSETGYTVNHTGSVFIVDPQGYRIGRFVSSTDAEVMIHDLRLMLNVLPQYREAMGG